MRVPREPTRGTPTGSTRTPPPHFGDELKYPFANALLPPDIAPLETPAVNIRGSRLLNAAPQPFL
ncbi:hypothetical protein [Nocardia brasiliensis]|uniref:hypothetical protein n=1 Tax=Nocardia brasiliensis TaxID=37326 RepID=UPI0009DA4409